MPEFHVWPTLVGGIILTRDAIGFAYCAADGIAKLRSDLESGVPLNEAIGFSGSCCPFENLVIVESKESSPTIYVLGRDVLGGGKEDFTFRNTRVRDQFLDKLVELLGAGWQRQRVLRGGLSSFVGPVVLSLFGLGGVCCGSLMYALPDKRADPKQDSPLDHPEVMAIVLGIHLLIGLIGVIWFFFARKNGGKVPWIVVRHE